MNIKRAFVLFLALLLYYSSYSQDLYLTRNGKISFFSKTPLENIDAVNNEVFGVIDIKKGDMAFAVLIKGFKFQKALMEEHFNENYMESDKLPKSTFNGKITNLSSVDFRKDGTYQVTVEGDLTIHGVTRKINTPGKILVKEGRIASSSSFSVKVADYQITVPSLVAGKIAETIDVMVDCLYVPKEKQ